MKELMQNLLDLQNLEFGPAQSHITAATIADLRGKIPPAILGHYDRLRVRGKKGLAAVQNQVCTGCHMRVPIAVIMTIKHEQDIQLCESCGRYLYLPANTESTSPSATAARKPKAGGRARVKGPPRA